MKKKIYCLCLLLLLCGCSNNKKENATDDNAVNVNKESEVIENNIENNYDENPNIETKEYKVYEPSPEWNDHSVKERAVQIDDVLYWPGLSVDDFISKLNESEVDYQYDYNKDKLITGKNDDKIIIYRDGLQWFEIYYINCSEDSIKLSEAAVYDIVLSENVIPYCRYINGKSYDELIAMNYDEVKELCDVFVDYKFNEGSSKTEDGQDIIRIELWRYEFIENFEWTGYELQKEDNREFIIDSNSGKVISYSDNVIKYHTFSYRKIK